MHKSPKATLKVNKITVEMNPFVEEFLARTSVGAVSSLRGTGDIKSLVIHQEKGDVSITVDGKDITLTAFPKLIISNTLIGLVSTLNGIDKIDSLDIGVMV